MTGRYDGRYDTVAAANDGKAYFRFTSDTFRYLSAYELVSSLRVSAAAIAPGVKAEQWRQIERQPGIRRTDAR